METQKKLIFSSKKELYLKKIKIVRSPIAITATSLVVFFETFGQINVDAKQQTEIRTGKEVGFAKRYNNKLAISRKIGLV